MSISAAIRTRSNGDWHGNEHFAKLELGGEVINSLTHVAKDSLIFEVYEGDKITAPLLPAICEVGRNEDTQEVGGG